MRPDIFKLVAYLLEYGLAVLWVHFNDFADEEHGLEGGEGGAAVEDQEGVHQGPQEAGDRLREGLRQVVY